MLENVVLFAQWASFFTWAGFVILYHVLTHGDWRKSPQGRNIMGVALSLAFALGLIVSAVTFGPFPGRRIIQFVIYGMIILFGLQRVKILLTVQREAHRVLDPLTAHLPKK